MKNKLFISLLFIISALILANVAYADEFTINTSIPGATSSSNPIQMIEGFYKFALAISGILAVAVILFGAVKYMASPGSAGGQSDAKEWITSALLGILLLAGAYLILNTINPELTILRLPTLEKPAKGTGNSGPVGTIGEGLYGFAGVKIPAGTLNDLAVRSALTQMPGVSVNKGNCKLPAGQTSCSKDFSSCTDCTSLDGLPQSVISGVKKIWQNCGSVAGTNCVIRVTGGTEAGHSSHRMGLPIIDLGLDPSGLDKYIWAQIGESAPVCKIHKGKDGISYMRETPNCTWKPVPHWHIVF